MADKQQPKVQNIETGQLALRCAEFFMSLSESCYQFYHTYKAEKQRKTKQIAKNKKNRIKQRQRGDEQNQDRSEEQIKKRLPKKPLTAYIIYFQQKKPQFVQRHPDLNLSELTKLIAKQWKQINDSDRKPYLDQAQEDRKRYDEQMKQFKNKYGTNILNAPQNQNEAQNQVIQQDNQNKNNNKIQEQMPQKKHNMEEQDVKQVINKEQQQDQVEQISNGN